MIQTRQYVQVDASGTFRVGATQISLDSVVAAFLEGHSPESILQEYPALTLEEVYGAVAFYLANRELVHQYLVNQEQRWEELRRQIEAKPNPVVERLRTLKAASRQEKK